HVLRLRLEPDQLQHFLKRNALPVIIKAAPARDAVEVTVGLGRGQAVELLPGQPHRLLHQPSDTEVPACRVKTRHRAIVQHRPLQRERLPRRQAAVALHLLLFGFALVAGKDGVVVHKTYSNYAYNPTTEARRHGDKHWMLELRRAKT